MRLAALLPIAAGLALTGCSTVSQNLTTDVWLCAYQVGDRYRDDSAKPDITSYDLVTNPPMRWVTLNYLVPVQGLPPEKHTITCEASPWGLAVTANDGFKLEQSAPDTYPGSAGQTPSVQGRTADTVREAVRQTGIHVHIPGVEGF